MYILENKVNIIIFGTYTYQNNMQFEVHNATFRKQ